MPEGELSVEVVYALVDRHWRVPLRLPAGSVVGDAIAAARLEEAVPDIDIDPARLAVFGRLVTLATPLHEGDRVEVLRPLLADPKEVRRQRAARA